MHTFTCQYCHKEKTADHFVKGSKNPTMCLDCRSRRMREKKIKKNDSVLQFRKTISFSNFGLAMIAAFQRGGSASDACQRIFQQAHESLDPKMREIVHFYEKELLQKSPDNTQNPAQNVNPPD